MSFDERVPELRKEKGWRRRDLAERVRVGHTHLSRIENGHLNYGQYPSDDLIRRLAVAIECNVDDLRVLAKRVPESVRRRAIERPDAFLAFAACDDAFLDRLLFQIENGEIVTTNIKPE